MNNNYKTPFVILCYPRTGSYLLVDLLNQFPEIICYGEIFKNQRIELPDPTISALGYSLEKRNEDPLGFIKKLYGLESQKITGFKLFPSHNRDVWDWVVNTDEIKKICLIRSPFEIYVSLERANATGIWVNRGGKKSRPISAKLRFAPEKFDNLMVQIRLHNRNLERLVKNKPDCFVKIRYDQLTRCENIRELARFVGVNEQPDQLLYRLQKQTVEKHSEIFENFHEMMDHLKAKYPKLHESVKTE